MLKMHLCEIHRAAHAFGCIIPNEADLEITNCRLAEIESKWHRASRPSKLFQEANYNEHGDLIYIHGGSDGKHAFKYGEVVVCPREGRGERGKGMGVWA